LGLNRLEHKAEDEKFSLKFYLNSIPDELPEIKKECFYLHAVPALNLFQYDASPVQVTHQQFEYRLVPDEGRVKNATIYNILSMEGFRQGEAVKRIYRHVNDRQVGGANSHLLYKTHVKNSLTSDGQDTYLILLHDVEKELPQSETLSIKLDCTNGHLPEVLSEGEICESSSSSPDLMKFRNLYSPSPYKEPPREEEWMWRFQSLLSLNFLSIANRENLQQLLTLYLVTNKGQHVSSVAYERRIESIKSVKVSPINHLISGIMMRGQEVQIECDVKKFLSFGDMYLFGSLMNHFLSAYVSINTFRDFQMRDSLTGELYKWPIQMGEQLLI
jgi:type VI secretion system protein ImpG